MKRNGAFDRELWNYLTHRWIYIFYYPEQELFPIQRRCPSSHGQPAKPSSYPKERFYYGPQRG